MSAQAVGGAVGHNAISIIIPCHRVVGAGGNLTGYAGGIDRKVQLLTLEHADTSGFFVQGGVGENRSLPVFSTYFPRRVAPRVPLAGVFFRFSFPQPRWRGFALMPPLRPTAGG